jgi:hypothetical protein
MQKLLLLPAVALLSACASMPLGSSTQMMQFNGQSFQSGPTSIHDPRLGDPAFYSESDNVQLPSFRP